MFLLLLYIFSRTHFMMAKRPMSGQQQNVAMMAKASPSFGGLDTGVGCTVITRAGCDVHTCAGWYAETEECPSVFYAPRIFSFAPSNMYSMLYPRHTGGAVPLRLLVKTAITAVAPPVVFHSFSPTRHT